MYRPIITSEDKQIQDLKTNEKFAPIPSRQFQVLYNYTHPWKLSLSLKWILYGSFFQTRIRPLVVFLQNAVQFSKAREIQNRMVSAFSPLPREKR